MSSIIERIKSNAFLFKFGKIVNIILYDYILDSFELLIIKLRKRGILSSKKFSPIKKLKNSHKGERCFIVATGPSLTIDDLNKLKGEFVIGVNSIVKILDQLEYLPQYIGIQDSLVYDKIGNLIETCNVKHIILTDKLYKTLKKPETGRYIQFPLYSCRHAIHGEMMPLSSGFSEDVSNIVYSGYSITYSMLQFAVYLGFTEIHLLGCDCSYDTTGGKQHFVESGHFDKYADTVGERMIYAYTVADKWLKENRPEVKVYNATRGGMLEVFPRKTLDEVFGN